MIGPQRNCLIKAYSRQVQAKQVIVLIRVYSSWRAADPRPGSRHDVYTRPRGIHCSCKGHTRPRLWHRITAVHHHKWHAVVARHGMMEEHDVRVLPQIVLPGHFSSVRLIFQSTRQASPKPVPCICLRLTSTPFPPTVPSHPCWISISH